MKSFNSRRNTGSPLYNNLCDCFVRVIAVLYLTLVKGIVVVLLLASSLGSKAVRLNLILKTRYSATKSFFLIPHL